MQLGPPAGGPGPFILVPPREFRIPVAALKGRSPWPLDDGGGFFFFFFFFFFLRNVVGRAGLEPATLGLKVPCSTN